MDDISTLKIDSLPQMRNLARVVVKNSLVHGVRVLHIKAESSYQQLMPYFLELLQNEITSQNGHTNMRVEVVPSSHRGVSIDLGYYIRENKLPIEASDFFSNVDVDKTIDTFYRKIGGSPALIKPREPFPIDFSLERFVEAYSEEVLFNSRLFKEYGIHVKHFDFSVARNVSKRLQINPDHIDCLGQVFRGELVELDYLSGRDYNPDDVKSLAKRLLEKYGDRLNNRIFWVNESFREREPVFTDTIKDFYANPQKYEKFLP
jgi:hypothetical protein